MDRLEPIALELLELKLAAYVDHGLVRGGPESLRALHDLVERGDAALDEIERARLRDVTRRLADAGVIAPAPSARPSVAELTLDGLAATPAPAHDEEGAALFDLAARVWRGELEHLLATRALAWWAERERITPRLIASTLRALQAGATGRGRPEPLAAPDDPLVSFGDPGAVVALAHDLIDAIVRAGTPPSPRGGALAVVRDAMLAIARDPHAGQATPGSGPGTASLQVAIEELEKERLPEAERAAQRRALERRRDEARAEEERARALLRVDVQRYVAAVAALFADLERHLPIALGGASPPFTLPHVLHALAPERRCDAPPPTATTLTAHLKGPLRCVLQRLPIAILGAPGAETLYLDRAPWPLRDGAVIDVGARIHVYRVGAYVHLRSYPHPPTAAAAFAEALLHAHLLTHERHATLLAVVAAIVGDHLGATADRVARWVAHGRALLPDHGVDPEGAHASLSACWDAAVAASGVQLTPAVSAGVVTRWCAAVLQADPPPLEAGARAATVDVAASGAAFDLGPLPIDVKPAPSGHPGWLVSLPGRVLGVAAPTLIAAVPDGVLVVAIAEGRAATLFMPQRALRAARGRA